jgi:hypothetical protein
MDFTSCNNWLLLTDAFAHPHLELEPKDGIGAPPGPHARLVALALVGTEAVRAEFPYAQTPVATELIVGDHPGLLEVLSGVHVWEAGGRWPNRVANSMLHELISDVVSGDLAVSDRDRDRLRCVEESPWTMPVLRGHCLVTGPVVHGHVHELAESFVSWWRDSSLRVSQAATDWRLEANGLGALTD